MTQTVYYTATTLDGFIATDDHSRTGCSLGTAIPLGRWATTRSSPTSELS